MIEENIININDYKPRGIKTDKGIREFNPGTKTGQLLYPERKEIKKGYLSFSRLKKFLNSPAHYKRHYVDKIKEESQDMRLGKIVEEFVLNG